MAEILKSISPDVYSQPVLAASIEDCKIGQSIQVGNATYKMIDANSFMDNNGQIVPRTVVENLSSMLDPYNGIARA